MFKQRKANDFFSGSLRGLNPSILIIFFTFQFLGFITISVGVTQCIVDLTVRVYGCKQCQTRTHRLLCHCTISTFGTPHTSAIFSFRYPTFVNTNNSFPLSQQLYHLESILLSKHQAVLCVGLYRNFLDVPVAQPKVLAKYLSN